MLQSMIVLRNFHYREGQLLSLLILEMIRNVITFWGKRMMRKLPDGELEAEVVL